MERNGTVVPIHRHPNSNENVILLCGKLVEIIYDSEGNETERYHLDPSTGNFGCVVPASAWHTVQVLEPSVIYEAKDGKYGEPCDARVGTKTKWILGDVITLVGRLVKLKFNGKELRQVARFRGFDAFDDFRKDDKRAILGEMGYYLGKLVKSGKLNP